MAPDGGGELTALLPAAARAEREGDGRGGFFAVDGRAWAAVCALGMNAAVAYLLLARGTGGDNRTTAWSTHALETRTGIARKRARDAIGALLSAGFITLAPSSKPTKPRYRITPAHELPSGGPVSPTALNAEQGQVLAALRAAPGGCYVAKRVRSWERWGTATPRRAADELVALGLAKRDGTGLYRAAEAEPAPIMETPAWTWLPNALVDGAAGETPPVELLRQTQNVMALRLLVDLYAEQDLAENGGIHFRAIRREFTRLNVGERGEHTVWGFKPANWRLLRFDAPFAAPHLARAAETAAAETEFWQCWFCLTSLGLVECVPHLVDADTAEGEIIHPLAATSGTPAERDIGMAADQAARALLTPGQIEWAEANGLTMMAPVPHHYRRVQLVGIARLRYRARTSRAAAFMALEARWQWIAADLRELGAHAGSA